MLIWLNNGITLAVAIAVFAMIGLELSTQEGHTTPKPAKHEARM